MTAETERQQVAARALKLLAEQGIAASRQAYAAWIIDRAVTGIAAGGERAALAQIVSMVADSPADVDYLTEQCMNVIQQARHEAFPGNTGWIWDGESSRWTANRGGILVTAAWPRDQMPPVRADWFAVQKTGQPWDGRAGQVMENPGERNLPWRRPVLAEIPEQWWSDDWHQGVRYKIILGHLCSPCGRTDARVCIQPPSTSQAVEARCTPVDPDHVRLIVLDGKLSDYS